jgi:hypothetical protein
MKVYPKIPRHDHPVVPSTFFETGDLTLVEKVDGQYARKRTHRLRSSPKSGSGDAEVDLRVNGGTLNGKSHQPVAGD